MEGEKQGRVFDFDEVHDVIQAPLNERKAGAGSLVAEADLLILKVQRGAVKGHGEQFHKLVLLVLHGLVGAQVKKRGGRKGKPVQTKWFE